MVDPGELTLGWQAQSYLLMIGILAQVACVPPGMVIQRDLYSELIFSHSGDSSSREDHMTIAAHFLGWYIQRGKRQYKLGSMVEGRWKVSTSTLKWGQGYRTPISQE